MQPNENHPVVFIACKVFQNLIEHYLPADHASQVLFMDYGLHKVPKKLKVALQEQIDSLPVPSRVALGYGLCGNGLHGLKAGHHTLIVPRTDDCIALFLGSYAAYRKQFDEVSGTYYLSKGWLKSGSNPMDEYAGYVEKYGEAQANWLMDVQYQNYVRLAFVAHHEEDLSTYREKAERVATFCSRWGMRYEEIIGSESYIQQFVSVVFGQQKPGEDFLIINPGEILTQTNFLRY